MWKCAEGASGKQHRGGTSAEGPGATPRAPARLPRLPSAPLVKGPQQDGDPRGLEGLPHKGPAHDLAHAPDAYENRPPGQAPAFGSAIRCFLIGDGKRRALGSAGSTGERWRVGRRVGKELCRPRGLWMR